MQILLFNASPHPAGHTACLLDAAAAGVPHSGATELVSCSLGGRVVHPCRGCVQDCATQGRCTLDDDFASLADLWRSADAIILGSPVFTFGPPAPMYAFLERLRVLQRHNGPAGPKAVGIVAQGGAEWGGAEVTAQALLEQVLAVQGVPVSGDVPGASQGVIGRVPDEGDPPPTLLASATRLGARVVEMACILQAGQDHGWPNLRVLAALATSGLKPQAEELLEAALAGAREQGDSRVATFDFSAHEVAPCQACQKYCARDGECIYHDGMQIFREQWLPADAVLWVIDADHGGPNAAVRAALDRMDQIRFETHLSLHQAHLPRYLRAVGVLALGTSAASVGTALQFLHQSALLYQDLPFHGVAGPISTADGFCVAGNGTLPLGALDAAYALGQRVTDMAATVRAGVIDLADALPEEYFASCVQLGRSERRNTRYLVHT